MPPSALIATVVQARMALLWSQRQLGDKLGASMRTVSRWEAGRAHLSANQIATLAMHVYPKRPDLAEQLAAAIGHTLVGLGIAPPPAPVAPVVPSPPPNVVATKDLIDLIVYTAADVANVAPKEVRGTVLVTLKRAVELGLDLGAAMKEGALSESRQAAKPPRGDG
jgi:hypothetical protein